MNSCGVYTVVVFKKTSISDSVQVFKPLEENNKSNKCLKKGKDFIVGVVIQPVFVVVIILFLLEEPSGYCFLRFLMLVLTSLVKTSVFHLAVPSHETPFCLHNPASLLKHVYWFVLLWRGCFPLLCKFYISSVTELC